MGTTQAPDPAYTLEHAQQDIAVLRGQLAMLGEFVSTVSDKAVLLYAPGANAIPRGPTSWSFEDGTTDSWTAANGAVTNSVVTAAGWPTAGTHSLLLTANGSGQPQASSPVTITTFVPSQPGDAVSVSVDIYCPAPLSHVYCGIQWRDDTGALISEIDCPDTVFTAGQVLTLTVGGNAPDLTAGFAIVFGDHATDPNLTLIYGDNIQVQGNLDIAISPGGGTDPVGTVYPGGITSYFPTVHGVFTTLNAAGLIFNVQNQVFFGTFASFSGAVPSGVPALALTSPSNVNSGSNDSEAIIGLVGRSRDASNGPYIYLGAFQQGGTLVQSGPVYVVGGQLSYAAPGVSGGSVVAETWHTVTLDAGWTGVRTLRYKFLAEKNCVWVEGTQTHAAFTVNTNINNSNPIPAAYRPLSTVLIAGPGIPSRAGIELTSAGVFIAVPNGTSCTEADVNGIYPLD